MAGKMKFVYVITGEGEKKFWTKVGVAFENRDGSLNVKLEALPVDGQLHIRDYVPKEGGRDSGPRDATPPAQGSDDIPF